MADYGREAKIIWRSFYLFIFVNWTFGIRRGSKQKFRICWLKIKEVIVAVFFGLAVLLLMAKDCGLEMKPLT